MLDAPSPPAPADDPALEDPIVVTGIGLVTPLGTGREAVWRALCAGESGIREAADGDLRREAGVDPTPLPELARAGWVQGFRPREHVRSAQLRRMDWCSRMLVAASRQAFDDAGLLPLSEPAGDAAAIAVGSCFGNQRETEAYLERILRLGPGAGQPLIFPNLVLNAAAGYAAIELGARGPNLTVSEHDASGEAALAAAVDLLRAGACEVACAGGVDEIGSVWVEALAERRLLHPDCLPPERRSRAQAARRGLRGGVVPGEGAAMLLLEPASRAARRGARVYATVATARVGGTAASPYGMARDADAAARRLLALAGLGSATAAAAVSSVLGCADGSPASAALDGAVLRALGATRGSAPAYLDFRRWTGTWGASGALGVALGALALDAGGLPGSAGGATLGAAGRASTPRGEATDPGVTADDPRPTAAGPGDPAMVAAVSGEALPVGTRRILVIGAARSGVLAPVLLEARG